MLRRSLALLLLLLATAAILWAGLDLPPLRLVVAWGLPDSGGPTGRTFVHPDGTVFAEIAPGYARVEIRFRHGRRRSVRERVEEGLGLRPRPEPMPPPWSSVREWVEIGEPFWLSTPGWKKRPVDIRSEAEQHIRERCRALADRAKGTFAPATAEELRYACGFAPFRTLDRAPYPSIWGTPWFHVAREWNARLGGPFDSFDYDPPARTTEPGLYFVWRPPPPGGEP